MKDVTLHKEDCKKILANLQSNSIDLVLIDPPYLISKKENTFAEVNT